MANLYRYFNYKRKKYGECFVSCDMHVVGDVEGCELKLIKKVEDECPRCKLEKNGGAGVPHNGEKYYDGQ